MPLVFIHGVNTRSNDKDYARGVAARRTMFEQFVTPVLVKQGFSGFTVAEDIYWGDLGVNFGWNLRSVPGTSILQSLGPEDSAQNIDLLELAATTQPASNAAVQKLGPAYPLVIMARQNPAALVRAIFAPEADRFSAKELRPTIPVTTQVEIGKSYAEGEHLAFLLIAAEELARDLEKPENSELIKGSTDSQVATRIQDEVWLRYQKIVEPKLTTNVPGKEHLGAIGNPIAWTLNHLKDAINSAKKVVGSAVAETERGASLVAMKLLRDSLSRKGLRFLGDVFVYLHHGRTASPAIFERVKSGVLALSDRKTDTGQREPLIVVTHSFGSEILYDLLIEHQLDEVEIDLWVTAGAQTSLFAEMLLFNAMPHSLPSDTSQYFLGRPQNVKKWINFYNAADVLSYLHEPVFGPEAVKDKEIRAQANLTNAHGHYFAAPLFYEQIAAEL